MPYKDPEKQLAYQRAWQQKAIAQGLCKTCRAPRKRSKYVGLCTRCGKTHRKSNARWNKTKGNTWKAAWRRKRIAEGLCTNCGNRAQKHRVLCRPCRVRENALDTQRRREARTWWSVKRPHPQWWSR